MKKFILATIKFIRPFLILMLGLGILFLITGLVMVGGIYWEINAWPMVVSILAGTFLFFAIYFSFGSFKYSLKDFNKTPKTSLVALFISNIVIFGFIYIILKYFLTLIN